MVEYPAATLSISFSTSTTEENALLMAEITQQDNGGETTFSFGGAAPKFRVYKSNNISSVRMFVSDGNTPNRIAANKRLELTENVYFSGAADKDGAGGISYRQVDVEKPVKGDYSVLLSKGNLGSLSLLTEGMRTFQCSKVSTGPLDPVAGFARIQYLTKYDLYELTGVQKPQGFGQNGFNEYGVIVYMVGVVDNG